MNSNNLLNPVWLKINRAKEHFKELENEVSKFIKLSPYELIRTEQPSTGDILYKLKVHNYPPDRWSPILGDVIHNLRSSLDILVTQLVISNGSKPNKSTGFPVYTFKKDLKKGGFKKIKGVSPKVKKIIRLIKPYRRANRHLWELHMLDISDKHKIIIGIGGVYKNLIIDMTSMFRGMKPDLNLPPMPIAISPKNSLFPLKDGAVLYRIKKQGSDNLDQNPSVTLELAFGHKGIIEGTPLIPKLQEFITMTENIVSNF